MTPKDYLTTYAKDCKVLYYPGSGTDLGPFNLFADFTGITHAIYADYWIPESEARIFLDSILEWTCSKIEPLAPKTFGIQSWAELWHPDPASHLAAKPDDAYAMVAHLSRGERRIKFYFIGAEAIGTYSRLGAAGLSPDVVVLQDHGFGRNWDTFGGIGHLSEQAVGVDALPPLLLIADNTKPWRGYEKVSGSAVQRGQSENGHDRAIYRLVEAQT